MSKAIMFSRFCIIQTEAISLKILIDSGISRAIFKLVYWFVIPNSDPQTLKSVKINSSKNRQMTTRAMFWVIQNAK